MKHIIFGGFDYAVLYEMNHDAVWRGVDYFVDNDPARIGTTYLGKPIEAPLALLEEDRENIIILIGSIIYRTEIAFQLKDMGFEEDTHFIWAISFCGDEKCPRLWRHVEWSNRKANAANLQNIEESEYPISRLKIATRFMDFNRIDTVVDLGAANGRVKEFLPSSIRYIPSDFIQYSHDTVLCDFNKYEFPDAERLGYSRERTCILSMINLQYCRDWKWYLQNVAKNCDNFILGLVDFSRINREYRRERWTANAALFDHEVIRYILSLGFVLVDSVDFRLRATIYKFEKKS
ncbi:MAG: glycosyltransferase [Caproiciproducens sp.]|nr:glycosyltransferase [Clostridia bacterium]MDF2631811.1 glycosyltransferase [Caproiciproducens sp.]